VPAMDERESWHRVAEPAMDDVRERGLRNQGGGDVHVAARAGLKGESGGRQKVWEELAAVREHNVVLSTVTPWLGR